ncbi:MAG: ATP-binding protein, partial [Desulfobacterales bacterium]|nr:ATP-binding protein [Desulfobacterales bacterium]
VSQILAFSRERQGSLEPLNPAPIVKEVLKLARSTLPANINIIQQISPDPGVVMADAVQLHQVVMNIISNAFHAMEISGGTLTVFLDKVSFTDMYDSPSGRNDNWLCLSITDTGDGIDPEIMDRIFDPYFTTKPQNKGTGLGLAVTHGIIKSFGGEIEVSSTPGEGSCFSISLPLTKGEGEDQYDREPDRATLRLTADGETLLVVDDEAPIIRVLDAQLTNAGYRVETFTSSPDALFAFTSSPDRYDLIISDFTMPEMTGDLLSKRVRQIRPEIPFLLMSGKNAADRLSDQLPEGIRAVLTKPVDKQTLLTTIKENLP